MARTDIFKRIKGDKLIDNRIQKYRLHFDYLKTCLEFPNDFKVDKSKYTNWKLNLVSKYKFDKWWSQVGKNLFEKEIEQVKEVRTPRQSNTSTFIEIPNNTPTEYAIEKIRDILQTKTSKTTNERLRPLELQIYLETFKLRKKKIRMLEMLWEVAYVDGELDPAEDMLIRRIAGLIHVEDRDRVLAKQRVLNK